MTIFTQIFCPNGRTLLFFFLASFCFIPGLHAQDEQGSTLPFAVWLESECATVGGNWDVLEDTLASGDTYVVIKPGFNSKDNPPEDIPANLVTFTLDVQEGDFFRLWARVYADNADRDSYWVRVNGGSWVNWNSRLRNDSLWTWREVAQSPFFMEAGEVTIDFAFREPATRLDKIYVTSLLREPDDNMGGFPINCDEETSCSRFPESCANEFWVEGECADLGSRWDYVKDVNTSNGGYVVPRRPSVFTEPTDATPEVQLSYEAELPEAGTYYLWMLMNAFDETKNSFFVRVDDEPWTVFASGLGAGNSILATDGFEWRQVNVGGDTTTYNLAAGTHTIYVALRESGTGLDKIALTRDSIAPTGYGKVALNCQTNDVTPVRTALDVTSKLSVFPNPALATLHLQLDAAVTGDVEVAVVDVNGRQLSIRRYQKSATLLADDIDVAHLPSGVYNLVVTSASGLITRPFVKR